jgi:hypothetical protein
MKINYNKNNLKIITKLIKKNLTPDLLPKKYIEKNKNNSMFGHCHTATGCLYKIFGSENVKIYRGFDGEIYHWWNKDKNEKIIDITAKQYNKKIISKIYEKGEKCGLLPYKYYRDRVELVYKKVLVEFKKYSTA